MKLIPLLYKDRRLEGETTLRQCQLVQLHLLYVFDVNKRTEFRVTLLPSEKLQLVTQNDDLKVGNDDLKVGNDDLKVGNDDLKKSKQKLFASIEKIIFENPGIQRKQMAATLNISVSTLDRQIREMTKERSESKIEHRGDRRRGGWFPKS